MRLSDVIGMCLRNLWKRKLRTFLTLLGVIIGTGSIIVMISLGLATDAQFAQMIEDAGLDMTAIDVFRPWGGEIWRPDGTLEHTVELTDETANRISRIPGVLVATPMMQTEIILIHGQYAMWGQVMGLRPEALELMGYETEFGRLLEPGDENFAVVIGSRMERQFFSTRPVGGTLMFGSDRYWRERQGEEVETLVDIFNDPIRMYYDWSALWRGSEDDDDFAGHEMDENFVPIRSVPFDIIGVLEHQDMGMWGGGSNATIYMNIEGVQQLMRMRYETERRNEAENEWLIRMQRRAPDESFDRIFVRVDNMNNTRDVAEAIEAMGYGVSFQGDWIDQQRQQQAGIQTLLAAIAAVSLAVAAINIANTMITSVTERTREIGVMKVIGATLSDIRKLFLLEAAAIGLIGGLFGIALALGLSYAMNNFDIAFLQNMGMGVPEWMRQPGEVPPDISLITPWLCLLALGVAGTVGIVSGFYPAWRATRLSALAAIRGE